MTGPRYPEAEWLPWRYPDAQARPTYYKGINEPIAVVLHVQEGWQTTARQWALDGHYGASWHFTVGLDGHVMQHLDFEDGGYHAGITDVQARQKPPTWALWKGLGRNVNTYVIGIEHEGFSGRTVLVKPEQKEASRRLCQWLAGELGIPLDEEHFPPHAAIDLVNRVNDFDTPARRAVFYEFLKGDGMTPEQEAMLTELWRRTGGDRGRDFDLLKLVDNQNTALTAHIEEHPGGDGIPEHDHEPGGVRR